MPVITLSKYAINQLIFGSSFVIFWLNFISKVGGYNQLPDFIVFVISLISIHYLCNITHLASHNLLSKNPKINNIIGFIDCLPILVFSFIDFKITHLEHHKHTSDHELDPDWKITNTGNPLFLPFRIVYFKDAFFVNFAKGKSKTKWLLEYILERALQIVLFFSLYAYSSTLVAIFWVLPLLIVGLLNAAFLYFYPHYSDSFERFFRSTKVSILQIVGQPFIYLIETSRVIHYQHHLRPAKNLYYFPEIWMWKKSVEKSKS